MVAALLRGGGVGLVLLAIVVVRPWRWRGRASCHASQPGGGSAPWLLEVWAAALQAGLPVAAAYQLAWRSSLESTIDEHVAGSSEPEHPQGGEPVDPLQPMLDLATPDALSDLADWGRRGAPPLQRALAAARHSMVSGGELASVLVDLAAVERAEQRRRISERIRRAQVWSLLPLGLCYLPAYLLLGIAPDLLGFAHDSLAGAFG